MTKAEIESKLQTIRNNNALPDKQKGMLIDKYEKMLSELGGTEKPATKPQVEKKPKATRVSKPKMTKKKVDEEMEDYDCDELERDAKERKAKAAAAYEKRKNAPKKTPATKNKEAIEKVEKNIASRVKKDEVSVSEIEKLIEEYEEAIKKLKAFLEQAKGKMAKGGSVDPEEVEHLLMKAKGVKEHHCGCKDKMATGGTVKGKRVVFRNNQQGLIISNDMQNGMYQVQLTDGTITGVKPNEIKSFSKDTYAKGGSIKELDFDNSNLILHGFGRDTNGNSIVKVGYPNQKAFSLQINNPEFRTTYSARNNKLSEISESELAKIEKEVVSYVEKFGSAKQKSSLKKYSGMMAKGGSTGSNYEIELFWKGLSENRNVGKYVVSEKTLENLEEQYGHVLSIDVLDESDKTPISWFELKKDFWAKGRERGFYKKGGNTGWQKDHFNFNKGEGYEKKPDKRTVKARNR